MTAKYVKLGSKYYTTHELYEALEELSKRTKIISYGLEEATISDRLLADLLSPHFEWFSREQAEKKKATNPKG